MRTSYNKDDVEVLLKDLTGVMKEQSTEEREKLIQSGKHYSEMLPMEKEPSKEYSTLYDKAVEDNKSQVADDVIKISNMILNNAESGAGITLVSLARAGIPVGILVKRYIEKHWKFGVKHYAISIIRDRGIDINAMSYIYDNTCKYGWCTVSNIYFIDGWTGKGVIKQQLETEVQRLKAEDIKWKDLRDDLYVLSDPAGVTKYCGTHKDYLIPSSCLNSTVSGLISRTILNEHIGESDFHGAVYFERFKPIDKSNSYIDMIWAEVEKQESLNGMDIVEKLCKRYNIQDYKKVKPGIGETTRVLLRRVPWKVFINNRINLDDADIKHIVTLCKEKNVPIAYEDLGHYKVCGVIKDLSADA